MAPKPALILFAFMLLLSSCSGGARSAHLAPAALPPTPVPPSSAAAAAPTAAAGTAVPAATVEPPPGSQSDLLIDAALQRGEINQETALVYKVYAQFGDARLPAAYKGAVNLSTDSHIIDKVEAAYATLSDAAKANVLPYLAPPIYAGAWGPPAGGGSGGVPMIELPCSKIDTDKWESTTAMHSPVRFWWLKSRPEDASVASKFMTAMDDDIWPKLTTVMGRTPLGDGAVECNGGGPEMDVYITPQVSRSYAAAHFPPGCRETPGYIVMNPAVSDAILAHEFMHEIQWSYNTSADCMYPGNYAWMAEATAVWAQDYVYPQDNEEHIYIPWFYSEKGKADPPPLDLKNDQHEYGAGIFFFYLTHQFDNPEIVKNAWENTTSMVSLDALDKAIPGGLDAVWGDFAVKNVIEPPQDEYQRWDQLNVKPGGSSVTSDVLSANELIQVANKIDPLSIKYEWYTFNDNARLITFFNGLSYALDDEPINATSMMGILPMGDGTIQYKFTARDPKDIAGLKIQAYYRVAGSTDWQLEDWTNKPYVSFCRDAAAEKLTDLIIITSDSEQQYGYTKPGTYESRLQVSDLGCWRYGGEASLNFTGSGEGGAFTDVQKVPSVAFERTDAHPNIPYPFLRFKPVEGQVDRAYSYKSTDGSCAGEGKANSGLAGKASGDLYVMYGALDGPSVRRYSGEANANLPVTVTFHCADGNPPPSSIPSQPFFMNDILSQILEKKYTVPAGGVLQGSDDMLKEADGAKMAYTWHFVPLAEPAGTAATGSAPGGGGQGGSGQANGAGGDSGSVPQSPGGVDIPGMPPTSGGAPAPGGGSASLPGIPDYPNVSLAKSFSAGTLMVITGDTGDQVAQYYREKLTGLGWTEAPSQGGSTNQVTTLAFSKDSAQLMIVISSQDGQTTFTMSLNSP